MTTIKLKNGSGAPAASDLVQGEPALDLTNKRLYSEDASGNVIEVGTNPTTLTVDTDTLVVDASNDRVGIGTTTVNRKLELSGNNNAGAKANYLRITDTDTTATAANQQGGIEFFASDSSAGAGVTASMEVVYAGSGGGGEITFNTAANSGAGVAEAMRIDESGNVGIGCSPSRLLDIEDTSASPVASLVSSTSGTPSIFFGDTDSDSRGRIEYENANDKMRFYAAGTNRLSIQSNGQILASSCVFTSAVQDYTETGLYLSNEGSSTMEIGAWRSGTSVAVLAFATDSGSDAAPVERARITGGGDFLVNRTGTPTTSNSFDMGFTPSTGTLYINSAAAEGPLRLNQTTGDTSSRLQIRFFRNESVVGSITSDTSATAYNTSSDVRLKENIVDAPAGNIDGIRVRSFDWKSDGTHQPYGMIAQELVSVAPEVVHQGETDDDMWEVDYSKLVPMMIKEIQDLKEY